MRVFMFFAIALVVTVSCGLYAEQPCKTSFGGRVENNKNDLYIGPDYRLFVNQFSSVDLFALTDLSNGIEFYGLYQFQGRLPGIPKKFFWFAGGGAHAGTWQGFDDKFVAGVDGIAGIEFCFENTPLSLSADWHPVFNIVTEKKHERFWPMKFGFTARYLIR